jgi:hypothetical protein
VIPDEMACQNIGNNLPTGTLMDPHAYDYEGEWSGRLKNGIVFRNYSDDKHTVLQLLDVAPIFEERLCLCYISSIFSLFYL